MGQLTADKAVCEGMYQPWSDIGDRFLDECPSPWRSWRRGRLAGRGERAEAIRRLRPIRQVADLEAVDGIGPQRLDEITEYAEVK